VRRDRLIRDAERGRFLVTTDADEFFEGVLVDWDESHFILADACSVTDREGEAIRTPIDNTLWIPRPHIKYMQAVRG
jgi:hypothetical protein